MSGLATHYTEAALKSLKETAKDSPTEELRISASKLILEHDRGLRSLEAMYR